MGVRRQQQLSPIAIIFEIRPHPGDTEALAVYGKLHHLLGTTRSRHLLGPEAVATLTSLDYLILHHPNGGPSLYGKGGESSCGRGARLALGERCWDICGVGVQGPIMDSALQRAGKYTEPLVIADQHRLEREIERVVKITSTSEVLSLEPAATSARLSETGPIRVASVRSTAESFRHGLQRLYARTQAAGALAQTPPFSFSFAPSPSPSSCSSSFSPGSHNPLLRVGVAALMSRRDCNTVLREARECSETSWAPWNGDLGGGAVAISVENLPRSRVLWAGKAGDAIRSRIAEVFGIPSGSVIADAGGVFVCKVRSGDAGGAGAGACEGGTSDGRDQGGERSARPRGETADKPSIQRRRRKRSPLTAAATFRRSRSLVSFCVGLSAEDAYSSWAVCMEQRGECLRLIEQGSGVIFSGKLRHASVEIRDEAGGAGASAAAGDEDHRSVPEPQRVVLLRGFASIVHPCVLGESARWQWGSPAWHVDAPWIKDQDILDRIWRAGSWSGSVPEATGQGLVPSPAAAAGGGQVAGNGTLAAPGSYYLERMNSTLAHRYYRQGIGGMGVPVVDHTGRPVIDVIEARGPFFFSRLLGAGPASKTGDVSLRAVLRRRFPWDRRHRQVGKAGFSTQAGASPRMDAALQKLFGGSAMAGPAAAGVQVTEGSFVGVMVPPIKYVFVDPRYRGLGLGRRLFLEAMRSLARRGFCFALIIAEDNGSGNLFSFYEDMGFVRADELLGLPRAMIAPIPPPSEA